MKKTIVACLIAALSVTSAWTVWAEEQETALEETVSEAADDTAAENIQAEGTHEVIDHAGNTVVVPDKIERVVIDQIPILSTYMSYFEGSAPYIVGYAGTFKDTISKTVLKDIAPELYEASDTVYAQSDLNIEEIVKLEPDVIFYNAMNKEHAEILQKSGIPAVGFATIGEGATPADPLERYKEWLRLLEDVFGEQGKMDAFFAAGDEIVSEVEAKIAEIPQEERPSAMILFQYNNGVPQVAGKGVFGHFWLQHLGVRNVAEETQGFAQVSFEEIYGWDPEVLFLNGPGICKFQAADVLENRIEGADFSSIQAVKDGRVYDTTLGMWNWFTPNPDAPLVLAWLACNTYPEQFADYPLEDTIREYYQTFYGYEISDEDLEGMLAY
ncbi:MAG: ABC transporter substrate-binding protein [Blautia sp.]|nr:ABC transporter substrate-binding protein [Blautia sp.]